MTPGHSNGDVEKLGPSGPRASPDSEETHLGVKKLRCLRTPARRPWQQAGTMSKITPLTHHIRTGLRGQIANHGMVLLGSPSVTAALGLLTTRISMLVVTTTAEWCPNLRIMSTWERKPPLPLPLLKELNRPRNLLTPPLPRGPCLGTLDSRSILHPVEAPHDTTAYDAGPKWPPVHKPLPANRVPSPSSTRSS